MISTIKLILKYHHNERLEKSQNVKLGQYMNISEIISIVANAFIRATETENILLFYKLAVQSVAIIIFRCHRGSF